MSELSSKEKCSACGHPLVIYGTTGWFSVVMQRDDRGKPCKKCGYLEPKELPEAKLVLCEQCACHYLDKCPQHG